MSRYFFFLVMITLISISSPSVPGEDRETLSTGTRASGHLIFVEDVTATWCQYCPSASEGLKDLSSSRSDFRFVTLVDDMSEDAHNRIGDYNVGGFPTVMFDGGYEYQSGAVDSGVEYNDEIDSCAQREVEDVEIDLTSYDRGGSELYIEAVVTNNGAGEYSGHLLVYVAEIVSRYLDYDGNPYPDSLLGFAMDIDISVTSGGTWEDSATWAGSEITDLQGNDYSDIDMDNIVIYGVLYNSRNSYKIQPGIYVAHYADAAGEAFPEDVGNAPNVEIDTPVDGSEVSGDVEITATVTSENTPDSVEVRIDQENWIVMNGGPSSYSYSWDSTSVGNRNVRISVRAVDSMSLTGIDSVEVFVSNEDAPTPPEIYQISQEPRNPREGETVLVTAEMIVYDTRISSVQLTCCIGEECKPPTDMLPSGELIYEYEMGPFTAGDEIVYEVTVKDDQGNEVTSQEYSFTVQSPEGKEDDKSADTGENENQSPSPLLAVLPISLILLLLISKRRRSQNG
jgi:thiol-disulfide isomerase/thioredoxin